MKLITNTSAPVKALGTDEAIRMLARAGFDALDWSFFDMWQDESVWLQDNWRETAAHIRDLCAACGLTVVQAHAPFPTSGDTKEFDDHAMAIILRAMEAASIMGATQIVVHPRQQVAHAQHAQLLFDESVALYKGLIPYCEQWNIRVCAENMWQYDKRREYIVDSICSQPDEFNALLDAVDSPWIIGCLDIGHCALVGVEPADFIRAMGNKRLLALHVHDVDWKHDNHDMPFLRRLNWEEITRALGEIDYQGDFTFEADTWNARMPAELQEAASVMLEKVGRYLIARVEAHRP
jgi:sugar phosphate isomerase/epimerase